MDVIVLGPVLTDRHAPDYPDRFPQENRPRGGPLKSTQNCANHDDTTGTTGEATSLLSGRSRSASRFSTTTSTPTTW